MQLGERQFTGGTTRPVYRSDDAWQYVLDDQGEPVYGVWLRPGEYRERVGIKLLTKWSEWSDSLQ